MLGTVDDNYSDRLIYRKRNLSTSRSYLSPIGYATDCNDLLEGAISPALEIVKKKDKSSKDKMARRLM